jgi:hypothetical protein
MTLKFFVARDSEGKDWAPDTPHEVQACVWMLRKAWEEFQHTQETYAIIVNVRRPSADLIVITERGVGVLELKHKFGKIRINPNGIWMAGTSHIDAGIHLNPREQVRSYARELREKIISWILPAYMQTKREQWNKLKFQTGVCFTNPKVDIQESQEYLAGRRPVLEPWESNFSIMDLSGFTTWIRGLRFELKHDPTRNFDPVRIEPKRIIEIATTVLKTVEWTEIYSAMSTGHPYGYLILKDSEGRLIFNLIKDRTIIGRNPDCDVIIPERYGRVSKVHSVITRNMDGVFINDLQSRNGTFIVDKPIVKATEIQHGTVLTLGGVSSSGKVCTLRFELHEKATLMFKVTEKDSLD